MIKDMAKMKLTSLEEINDKVWGPIGTPERDKIEVQLKEDLEAYLIGEAIKKARQAQDLTQEQLGERVGVQKAQISKLERGRSVITLPTISKIFKALGVQTASLDLGVQGKVTLW